MERSEFEAELCRWGNSLAARIPKAEAAKIGAKSGTKVRIVMEPLRPLKAGELFGIFAKELKSARPTLEELREMDRELDSKW
ncbi:hypothetical protein HY995_04410 [Candidatus Micrarchaeota archaeon]|nr:hypothetical protein [Candidatus Micrarchaeota archaeon]MBI5177298.1 hypothetical protein [Candidatus Micrarchaeota archaeon]